MPLARFEPTIPVFKRAKIFHALDRAATVTGHSKQSSPDIVRMKSRRMGWADHVAIMGEIRNAYNTKGKINCQT
jgi:hypothetical protein